MADLTELWEAQASQQRDLGMDPRTMSDVARRGASADLMLCLHEEVGELQKVTSHYKRHILTAPEVDPGNVADEVADVLKLVIAIAQLHDLVPEEVLAAFHRKTNVVKAKAEQQRVVLAHTTKVLCVDLDDVVCDLSPWTLEKARLKGSAPNNARTLQMMEAWKDEWYKSGRFLELVPVPGAREALVRIAADDFKIVIITARPQWQYKRIYADTLEWLQRHGIPHDLILFNKDKVEAVFEHVAPAWPAAFVEDHEKNARALSRSGIPVLLFDQPHNRDLGEMELVRRVFEWGEVPVILKGG